MKNPGWRIANRGRDYLQDDFICKFVAFCMFIACGFYVATASARRT